MNKVLIAFALIFWLLFPFVLVWSMNVLFPVLAIPYTFQTYIAASVLSSPIYNIARIKLKLCNDI